METIGPATFHTVFLVFKSYYVVWKPRYLNTDLGPLGKFKSYYVVWKLNPNIPLKDIYTRLNRTM